MVVTTKIRVAVLEDQYASLEDHGVPLSVCLQLQQLGVKLHEAQWTARHSLGGFSISFFLASPGKKPVIKETAKYEKENEKEVCSCQPCLIGVWLL